MPVLALDHINIAGTPDLIASCRDFYVGVLGLSEGYRPPFRRSGFWLYADDKPVVHLVAGESDAHPAASAFNHVAFLCIGLEEVVAQLEARGIAFERTEVPATGDVQLFLVDPAGVQVELRFPSS